jgi:hypothetical protein
MPSDRFQIAAERAASSYPTDVWSILSPSERAAAIYRELRKLDAESASDSEQTETLFARTKPINEKPINETEGHGSSEQASQRANPET